ncbi:MAG TPA: hypothetical protein VEY31_06575 [Roseococcus sp.]|nr:hypothetical protein [Roseococcus sp.]
MAVSMMHLAPGLLTLFMLALALVPLALAWHDQRRRAQASERLRLLRGEARVSALLRGRPAASLEAIRWDHGARG